MKRVEKNAKVLYDTYMIIAVGATNEIKTNAAEETVKSLVPEAQVLLLNMGVEDQIFGFEAITMGARTKAAKAMEFQKADIGVGIENALVQIESSGWFDIICVATITAEGKDSISFSAGFFIPDWITNEIKEKQTKISEIIGRLSNNADHDPVAYFSNHMLTREDELQRTVLGAFAKIVNHDRYHL